MERDPAIPQFQIIVKGRSGALLKVYELIQLLSLPPAATTSAPAP
eukprot:SAG22_NODE_575_length_8991_cov_12.134859_12_plen_45_part_00